MGYLLPKASKEDDGPRVFGVPREKRKERSKRTHFLIGLGSDGADKCVRVVKRNEGKVELTGGKELSGSERRLRRATRDLPRAAGETRFHQACQTNETAVHKHPGGVCGRYTEGIGYLPVGITQLDP